VSPPALIHVIILISGYGLHGRTATWGRIVGPTSGGPTGFPTEVFYGAAKATLENTMSTAFELAPLGITANVVNPPVAETGWITDDVRQLRNNAPA
jgi:3-oxoacyl-[acyl-carrier protein] reductase